MRINDTQLEKAIGGKMNILFGETDQALTSIKCPACGGIIVTTVQRLIKASAIICPHCQQIIKIERQNGGNAIVALRKVREAQDYLGAR